MLTRMIIIYLVYVLCLVFIIYHVYFDDWLFFFYQVEDSLLLANVNNHYESILSYSLDPLAYSVVLED